MDKFNVINITDDINELEQDMEKWSLLPYDLRRRSNDDCIRMYDVTVPELYTRLKNKIQSISDLHKHNDSNLVYENAWEELDNYKWLLGVSKNLQKDSYIVIIDPDIKTKEELNSRYNSFISLNNRLKKLSNNYSWQIWGYNVHNMYNLMSDIIDTKNAEDNSVDIDSNMVRLSEASINPIYDYMNHASLHRIAEAYNTYKSDITNIINTADIVSSTIATKLNNDISDVLEDYKLILPKYVPWFTGPEMNKFASRCSVSEDTNYYKEVEKAVNEYKCNKTEENEKAVLELGWNPSLDFNEYNANKALERQLKYIITYEYSDISTTFAKINMDNKTSDNEVDIYDSTSDNIFPIFLVENDGKMYLMLKNNSKVMYSFNDSFNKIEATKELLDASQVYMALIDKLSYSRLAKVMTDSEYDQTKMNICNLDSIYTILLNSRNKFDPAKKLILFAKYIECVLNLINCTNNSGILTNYGKLANRKAIYKINDEDQEYNANDISKAIDIIINNSKLGVASSINISKEPIIISEED